ncbi:hypothetical protein ABZT28_28190, partial [Streptomyces sp. NPDC005388]|uniref:hypothetical protein n=1 Tax=Streptomyces sp. NPDC005388 TaxID=3156717 RepID=UPI0033AB7918
MTTGDFTGNGRTDDLVIRWSDGETTMDTDTLTERNGWAGIRPAVVRVWKGPWRCVVSPSLTFGAGSGSLWGKA